VRVTCDVPNRMKVALSHSPHQGLSIDIWFVNFRAWWGLLPFSIYFCSNWFIRGEELEQGKESMPLLGPLVAKGVKEKDSVSWIDSVHSTWPHMSCIRDTVKVRRVHINIYSFKTVSSAKLGSIVLSVSYLHIERSQSPHCTHIYLDQISAFWLVSFPSLNLF
jgi:hypothetical protein